MELHALVLAAGSGSRFGGRKLLAPWEGGVLLYGSLWTAFAAPVTSVVLVTGADADDVAAAALDFVIGHIAGPSLRIVHAPHYGDGISASLRAGLSALPQSASGAFIFLGDMPRIPVSIPPALADAMLSRNVLAAAPVHAGQRGHPVLVSKLLFPQFMELAGDIGAKKILDRLGPGIALIATDEPGILLDVDQASDLSRIERA